MNRFYTSMHAEAGCDEAGRGCLAGPVVAASVILPPDFDFSILRDSKAMSPSKREKARAIIERDAITFGVASTCNELIDTVNILQASIRAMHLALEQLETDPQLILVDGNYFKPYRQIPHVCLVKGDANYAAIAAASILAKTYRDDLMAEYSNRYPDYNWHKNKGYPTVDHRTAIENFGFTPLHRRSFTLKAVQLKLF